MRSPFRILFALFVLPLLVVLVLTALDVPKMLSDWGASLWSGR
jgi:hypothetical protein